MNPQQILSTLDEYKLFIAIGAVLVLVLILIYARMSKKRKLTKDYESMEVRYNELMSIPVLFKINKANGLAKLNPEIEQQVVTCKSQFTELSKRQEAITDALADAEDAIAFGKLKDARHSLTELDALLTQSLSDTIDLNQRLEELLEQETKQRLEITALKDRFRLLRQTMRESSTEIDDALPVLEESIKDIEHHFSVFEEWMYASDFVKASEISAETKSAIDMLERQINEVPKLYRVGKGLIPQLLDEVSKLYQGVRQQGVFVDHLEVPKNIGVLSEILRDDLLNIKEGEIDRTKASLSESQKRLEQLVISIQKEEKATKDVIELSESVFETLDLITQRVASMRENAEKVEKRFNFEGYVAQIGSFTDQIDSFNEVKIKLDRMMHEEKIPASTIIVSLQELGQDVDLLKETLQAVIDKVDRANADEIRATKQLLKLHLIINDVQVRIRKRALPTISDKYSKDLKQASKYTDQIKQMLDQDVIDVQALNATVDEAIDYIYKLHNNVNNLVGVVDMCENAIVYANKFRAFVPDIDGELTRAELLFNNGEYTQSLTTIINSIDRYRPNSAYEEMIRDNAKSAR